LAADTIVVTDNEVLGKPENQEQGLRMLRQLSGKMHFVLTAVAVMQNEKIECCLSKSKVTFSQLSEEDINAYWQTGESTDKAGAYAIQGKAGMFVKSLEGSYSGVVGLPLYETANLLKKFNVKIL